MCNEYLNGVSLIKYQKNDASLIERAHRFILFEDTIINDRAQKRLIKTPFASLRRGFELLFSYGLNGSY